MNFSVAVVSVLASAIAVNTVPQNPPSSPPWGTPRRPKMALSSTKFILPAQGKITKNGEGIDIEGNQGDEIVAAANGVVIESRWDDSGRGMGQVIVIRHNESNKITIYAHTHKRLVNAGEKVSRGDAIAQMGRSGKADRTVLHFQIREKNGRAINPCKVLSCP